MRRPRGDRPSLPPWAWLAGPIQSSLGDTSRCCRESVVATELVRPPWEEEGALERELRAPDTSPGFAQNTVAGPRLREWVWLLD